MNKRTLNTLMSLNVLLVVAMGVVWLLKPQPASAQFGLRSDYVMIAGDVTGRDQAAVYILDLKSQRMASVIFDSRNKKLDVVAGREVANDLRAGHGR